ncbi:MAG: bifunctional adenosylcobinamide kinase/adenosylcobinamide-phosphate guanylyltransferase [Lachnospiraceae bacterium]|nr:bifunctional adenosylcobinamide kinase/adenosylcobinamide-phosphate guanylyltransferase [Lachnospiraceae bacterium]
MILVIGGAFQGKTEYVRENFGESKRVINHYHLKVKEELKEGKDPLKEAEALLAETEDCVIISDEIGYGLVPVDAFERQYREAAGRVNCFLAKRAEQVIRVVCGIGTRIA